MVVGPVRRQAMAAAIQTYAAASEGRSLIADLMDGFGVTIHVSENAIMKLMAIMSGQAGDLPLTVKVDPKIDAGD